MDILIIILGALVALAGLLWLAGFRIIPNDKVGIIEKRWSFKGSLDSQIIALNGEAGFQPNVIRGGIHFLTPIMYKIHIEPLITIPQGEIGYVFARDGIALPGTQTLGRVVQDGNHFQNVVGFLTNKGQKGIQREILREGTYAFNLAQFIIITQKSIHALSLGSAERKTVEQMAEKIKERSGFMPIIIRGADDQLGVVTVHDGPSLASGHIVAPTVGDDANESDLYHNNFQDIEKFLRAGGYRGRQYQVLTEGTYFINRMFATVELIPKTIIPVGSVGVVISYVGEKGVDASGEDYRHGELVEEGTKGVWKNALSPGKYAFNTYAGKISTVPTTNIILKWIGNEEGGHLFDSNLKEVSLITKDAFEPSLPLSVVLHIDYKKAPYVIQRFGDIKQLVEQTLDPMVSAYFKNIGQSKTLIELLQERSEIQVQAADEMKVKFVKYNIDLEEVLIGTPSGSEKDNKIDIILSQLRDRQVAREQIETYSQQEKAAAKERELNEAKSKAEQQTNLTESAINIEVQKNQGKAQLEKAKHDAEKLVALANADAAKVKALGDAEANKIAAIGGAEAEAIANKVKAYGGAKFQLIQDVVAKYTKAIESGKIQIVPQTMVQMGGGKKGSMPSPLEGLIGLLFTDKLEGLNLTDEEKEAVQMLAKKPKATKEIQK